MKPSLVAVRGPHCCRPHSNCRGACLFSIMPHFHVVSCQIYKKRLVWILLNLKTRVDIFPHLAQLNWGGMLKCALKQGRDDVLHQSVSQQTLSKPSGCSLQGCLGRPTSLQYTGAEERGGNGEVRLCSATEHSQSTCSDGVMGTASCGLNYSTEWWRRLVLFFF